MKNNAKLCHAGGARDDQRPTDGDIDCQISQANTRWQMQPTAQMKRNRRVDYTCLCHLTTL